MTKETYEENRETCPGYFSRNAKGYCNILHRARCNYDDCPFMFWHKIVHKSYKQNIRSFYRAYK